MREEINSPESLGFIISITERMLEHFYEDSRRGKVFCTVPGTVSAQSGLLLLMF